MSALLSPKVPVGFGMANPKRSHCVDTQDVLRYDPMECSHLGCSVVCRLRNMIMPGYTKFVLFHSFRSYRLNHRENSGNPLCHAIYMMLDPWCLHALTGSSLVVGTVRARVGEPMIRHMRPPIVYSIVGRNRLC